VVPVLLPSARVPERLLAIHTAGVRATLGQVPDPGDRVERPGPSPAARVGRRVPRKGSPDRGAVHPIPRATRRVRAGAAAARPEVSLSFRPCPLRPPAVRPAPRPRAVGGGGPQPRLLSRTRLFGRREIWHTPGAPADPGDREHHGWQPPTPRTAPSPEPSP